MNRRFNLNYCFVIILALAGCQTAGNGHFMEIKPTPDSSELQIGTSTKSDVERNFGVANVYHFTNGYDTWTYQKTQGIPPSAKYIPFVNLVVSGTNDRTSELALLFDRDGILRNIDWRLAELN